MSREVRRVPANWEHPRKPNGRYVPLLPGNDYYERLKRWVKLVQNRIDYYGQPPNIHDHMPVWTEAEANHLMMYECCSEGTPISPAFATAEELARWLTDNGASAFADMTASYEAWLQMIHRGWAPSAVATDDGLQSGVELGLLAQTKR